MSRIGKKPVELPQGVTAEVKGQTIEVKGPKGTRAFTATDDVTLSVEEGSVKVTPRGMSKRARQQWGMARSMVANLVTGVSTGFRKELEAAPGHAVDPACPPRAIREGARPWSAVMRNPSMSRPGTSRSRHSSGAVGCMPCGTSSTAGPSVVPGGMTRWGLPGSASGSYGE